MKLRNLFVINAIVALVYGISFVLAPVIVLSLYGVTQGPSEALMGQYFGLSLIAIGLLTWFARSVTDSDAQRAIILALLISDIIGVIVSVLGTVSGVMNAVGWSAVGIYLLLALGYAYFQFMKPSAS
jgi:ABC-type spermidine/putrescine transport system permease subunit II